MITKENSVLSFRINSDISLYEVKLFAEIETEPKYEKLKDGLSDNQRLLCRYCKVLKSSKPLNGRTFNNVVDFYNAFIFAIEQYARNHIYDIEKNSQTNVAHVEFFDHYPNLIQLSLLCQGWHPITKGRIAIGRHRFYECQPIKIRDIADSIHALINGNESSEETENE